MERFQLAKVKEIIKVDVANGDLPVARDAFYDIGIHDVYFGETLRVDLDSRFVYSSVYVDCVDSEEPRIRQELKKREVPFIISPIGKADFDG